MTDSTVFVLENQNRWAPELQRQFERAERVHVRGCRGFSDLGNQGKIPQNCVVVLDLSVNTAECLQYLGREICGKLCGPVVVMAPQEMSDLEWAVRELGVKEYLSGFYSGEELAKLCRRLLHLPIDLG
jgi:hypothetical protein